MRKTATLICCLFGIVQAVFGYFDTCTLKANFYPRRDTIVVSSMSVNLNNITTGATTSQWLNNGTRVYSGSNNEPLVQSFGASVGVNEFALAVSNGFCKDTARIYVVVTGTPPATKDGFKLAIGKKNCVVSGTQITKAGANEYIIGGTIFYYSGAAIVARLLFLTRMDDNGCIKWSKQMNTSGSLVNLEVGANGDIVATTDFGFIIRMDSNGEPKWTRHFPDPQNLFADSDGNTVHYMITSDNEYVATKVDENGNMIWGRRHTGQIPGQKIFLRAMIEINGSYYIGGTIARASPSTTLGFLTKVDKTTGNTIWAKTYSGVLVQFNELNVQNSQILVTATANSNQSFITLDLDGNVVNAKQLRHAGSYGTPLLPLQCRIVPIAGGDILVFNRFNETLPLQPYNINNTVLMRIHGNQIVWQEYFLRNTFYDAVAGGNNSLITIGDDISYMPGIAGGDNTAIIKIDADGKMSDCLFGSSTHSILPLSITPGLITWASETDVDAGMSTRPVQVSEDLFLQKKWTCQNAIDSCVLVSIKGKTDICDMNRDYVYELHSSGGCNSIVTATDGVLVRSRTDSTVTVRFTKAGPQVIKLSLLNSCQPLQESLSILVAPRLFNLSLGKDTLLCPGSSIELNAGSSFVSYQWQDGSTGQKLLVRDTGTYRVNVLDSCGNPASASIHIGEAPFEKKDLMPDKTICTGDTLMFKTPQGYTGFSMLPTTGLLTAMPANTVMVKPAVTTIYSFIINNNTGCGVVDTAIITVSPFYPFTLGSDTILCKGQQLVLSAININYVSYLWQNGNTTTSITVTDKGRNWLKVTDKNGCVYRDTMDVTDIKALPAISFPGDSVVCDGKSITLTAPAGMKKLIWQDGSPGTTFNINNAGKYWLTAINTDNCSSSDTITIKRKITSPDRFLTYDSTICKYDSITLRSSVNFEKYVWSNNSVLPVLRTASAGYYLLKVTDRFNCQWQQGVTVTLKDCYQEIYFPTGFTPNKDGLNDVFRPKIFGRIEQYHIVIYSKAGQKIFESTDPSKGWDGLIKSIPENSGTYVWMAEYRFPGQELKTQKGTISLLR